MSIIKRTICLMLCVFSLFSLVGCFDGEKLENDDFLAPPKPSGEMLYIKETLEENVSGKFTLKYPTDGDYRSAYVMCDLMGSGKENFALAFYSTMDEENLTSMHLALMKKVDDVWVFISDVSVSAIGIEKLDIVDLNGDGVKELAVGWNVYSGTLKSLMVYTLKGLSLVPIIQENYSNFISFDVNEKEEKGLFVLSHNMSEGAASAKLYGFDGEKAVDKGSCLLDGQVTSFYPPVVSKLTSGETAIFLDAAKGTGTQTEVLFFKNDILTRANFENEEEHTLSTYRNMSVLCSDINDDEKYDIPIGDMSLVFHPEENEETPATMIRWSSFNGKTFETTTYAAMNYTDGYYIEIPVRWFGKITVDAFVENRTHTVNIWDTDKSIKLGELLKVRTVTKNEWDTENNGLGNYFEVARTESLVYIATLGGFSGSEKLNEKQAKKMIHIIN